MYDVQDRCGMFPILAVHWIHVQHPVFPVQRTILADIERDRNEFGERTPPLTRRICDWLTVLPEAAKQFRIALFESVLLSSRIARLIRRIHPAWMLLAREKFHVVCKTWRFGADPPVGPDDFYFGDFQRRLAERGVRVLMLGDDLRRTDPIKFGEGYVSTEFPQRFPEYGLLTPSIPFRMILWQIGTFLKLGILSLIDTDGFRRRIYLHAAPEVLSHQSLLNGLNYWIARQATQTWNPRAFVTLYEGRSNERCLWAGARAGGRDSRIAGYQHVLLYPTTLCLLHPRAGGEGWRRSTPDVTLCLGDASREAMEAGHQSDGASLITFGSFRRQTADQNLRPPKPGLKTVLVLPQGFLHEAVILFDFAHELASRLPEHRFILRLHPFMPFSWVRPHLKHQTLLANVEISSSKEVDVDVARSSAALYMGSSAVLYTVLQGIKPFHVKVDGRSDVDPLSGMISWKETVSGIAAAEMALKNFAQSTDAETPGKWQSAVEWINRQAAPVDRMSIERFVEITGCQ